MPRDGQTLTLTDLVAKHCALGKMKTCTKCQEEWPADTEFFYQYDNKLTAWCRACICEASVERRKRRMAA